MDTRYQSSHGPWQDIAKNGNDFYHLESPKNQKRNARLLGIMTNGNTKEWDCTCLFYSILYSDSLGSRVNPVVKTAIDDLREFRNEVFAHTTDGELTEADFQASICKVEIAFNNLKLDTSVIDDIKNQKSFPTQELHNLQQQLIKEKKRNEKPVSFSVLPPKPSHETVDRTTELQQLMAEMQRLRSTSNNEVTVVYLAGNPGCGKSQVARQLGDKLYSSLPDEKFVFTFNASNEDALLQSYLELAALLKCDEHSLTVISTVKDLSTADKMKKVKTLVAPKIRRYSSWLMILDNVTNLKSVRPYFPEAGDKTSGEGQIIVTTQDSQYLPLNSAHTHKLFLSTGMQEDDAVATLTNISGLQGEEKIKLEVAAKLDFQPLALACAAVYMQGVAHSKPSWTKYLQKLEEGTREGTEEIYVGINTAYPSSMTKAVMIAVGNEIEKETFMMHTFHFLSVIAAKSIPLRNVVVYVKGCMSDKDEEMLSRNIRSSSLILWSEDHPEVIRVHQVIHNHLGTIFSDATKESKQDILSRTIVSFQNLDFSSKYKADAIEIRETEVFTEHFIVLAEKLSENVDSHQNESLTNCLSTMGQICGAHGKYTASKVYFQLVLKIKKSIYDSTHPQLATTSPFQPWTYPSQPWRVRTSQDVYGESTGDS